MSRIDDLIAEQCPEGVKFLELQDLFDIKNGYTPSKSNAAFWTHGTIPWFRMEDIRENGGVLADSKQHIPAGALKGGRLFPANSLLVATSATIGEHALVTVPHLSNQRFTSLSLKSMYANELNMRFAYYYGFVLDEWCLRNITTSSFSSVDMAGFRKFRFPIPPMQVQREIVRILDQFTQLEAELEAELDARRRQYEHYRDSLFEGPGQEVLWLPMGEVGEFIRGRRFVKDDFTETGIPCVHYGEIYTSYGTATASTITHLPETMVSQLRLAKPNDVILAAVGETVEDVGKAVAWLGDTDVAIHDDCFLYRHPLNAKFVSYYLQTQSFHSQKGKYVSRAKVKRLSREGLSKIALPVPPMKEQERIVEILDGFDTLLNDLSIGLPAELAARRKQYEYYRDRLLTFKEAAA